MLTRTHVLMAVAGASLVLETIAPGPMALAVFGSMLPDIDTSKSLSGRLAGPVSRWLENRFPHRTLTHSVLASALLAAVTWPLRAFGHHYWYALVLGH